MLQHPLRLLSLIKLGIGIILIAVVFSTINVYQDTTVGISMLLFGLFFLSWGGSFFGFALLQNVFHHFPDDTLRKEKESYKLSLLFGLYVLINVILLILEKRTKLTGFFLLALFILGQVVLFMPPKHEQG